MYENMQESQEVPMSSHLDEVVAAVSVTSKKRTPNKLPQTALFQPPREKLHLCEERAKSYSNSHEVRNLDVTHLLPASGARITSLRSKVDGTTFLTSSL